MTLFKLPPLGLALILLGLGAAGCVPPGGTAPDAESDADFRAGASRKQAGNYTRAIESFERVLQKNPGSAAAHFELGLIYYQHITNYVAAIYHFDRVQRLQPGFSRIDVVRQLIKVCKQELVQDAMGGFNVQMQRELERLERVTQENAALRQELAQLQAQLKEREAGSHLVETGVVLRGLEPQRAPRTEASGDTVIRQAQMPSTRPVTLYTVKRGETIYSIAKRYGLTEAALRAANPTVVPTQMSAGQVLRIPAP